MARKPSRRFTKITFILFTLCISNSVSQEDNSSPEFYSIKQNQPLEVKINETDYKKVIFKVTGRNIYHDMRIKATSSSSQRNTTCKELSYLYDISEIHWNEKWAEYELTVPASAQGNIYLCLPPYQEKQSSDTLPPSLFGGKNWYHQGPTIKLNLTSPIFNVETESRIIRGEGDDPKPRIMGLRLESAPTEPEFDDNGVPTVLAGTEYTIRIFGERLVENMSITFTHEPGEFNDPCYLPIDKGVPIERLYLESSAVVKINLPAAVSSKEFYMCAKIGSPNEPSQFFHQGSHHWLQLKSFTKMIPIWAAIIVMVVCLSFSALFSGLNLGLMSMDRTELKILSRTGTPREQKYASAIQPVRAHGNYLLCAILFGNVFVNSIFTLLLDDLTSGVIAVIFSTLAIVLCGEILPQAVCSRHGLAVGAKTIYITKFVMVLTFPLSYPIAAFLNWILGEEIGNVYTRERLKELVMVTTGENDLDRDEVKMISGALELRKKTVVDVMTKIEDAFMLDYEAVLDFETVSEIMKSGFSRIPVYEGNRQNIVTLLYIKDLAFVDPDDNTPLKTLCQFYQNPINFVFEDVTLDVIFKIFKEGNKGHMAFVHRVNNEGEGDPFYETIGIITLEDVIEELIQAEIMDETDVFTDNKSKRRRVASADRRKDFTVFADKRGEQGAKVRMSPQLTLAAFQYLSTSVEPFNPNVISETILRRLLKQDIVFHIKKNKDWRTDPANIIYSQGKAVDYFVIILEGRVEVTVGKENLVFEGGPFTYFGTQALVQTVGIESPITQTGGGMGSLESLNIDSMLRHTFIPDYTVRATVEVLYLRVKRSLYLAAKKATLMERSKKDNQTSEQFDEEVDKLLHSLDEDDAVSVGRVTPRRKSSKNLQALEQNQLQSPKTPSHYSNASPPHRLSSHFRGDVNGAVITSPIDQVHSGSKRDEEVSLLPKQS